MLVLFNISVLYMSFSSPERVLTAIYVFTFGGICFLRIDECNDNK